MTRELWAKASHLLLILLKWRTLRRRNIRRVGIVRGKKVNPGATEATITQSGVGINMPFIVWDGGKR